MPFEALGEAARFGGRKGLVERRRLVGVEIVLDEDDLLGIGEVDVGDLLQDMGVVDGGAVRRSRTSTRRRPSSGAKIMNRAAVPFRSYS